MKQLPNVWGRGALFAFSGLDGENTFSESLCAQLMGERIGFLFEATTAELYLRLTGTRWTQEIRFSLVGSDLIEGTLNQKPFGFAYADQYTVIGYAPSDEAVPIFRADLAEEKVFPDGKAFLCDGAWFAFASKPDGANTRFALCRHTDLEGAACGATAALSLHFDAVADTRRAYFDRVPIVSTATESEQKTLAKCFSVMKSQVYTPEGKFTCRWTTPDRTPHKRWWFWDSIFHSIGNYYVDPQLALDTLYTMVDVQDADGRIPHSSFPEKGWPTQTQPPLLAWALYRLYVKTGRLERVKEIYDTNRAHLQWVMRNRDQNGNHLYEWWVNTSTPDCRCGESGMDNTPRFDDVQGMDDIDFSCYMANEMRYMAKLARLLERPEEEAEYTALYEKIGERVNAELYDEEDGRYYDRDLQTGTFHKVYTPASLLPLFAGICPPERAKRLVADIMDPAVFNTPMPIPSVAKCDPHHCDDYWRGLVWINYAYMTEQGLRENGFVEEADQIADKLIAGIAKWYEREGCIFETYDPCNERYGAQLSRKGPPMRPTDTYARFLAVQDFGWSSCLYTALIMEREARAQGS